MAPRGGTVLSRQSAERRAHQRVETTVQVQGTPEEGGVVARMVASNLSLGGLYCTSSTDFPEMTRLAVRLLLPAGDDEAREPAPVEVEAVVVRRDEKISGVARCGVVVTSDLGSQEGRAIASEPSTRGPDVVASLTNPMRVLALLARARRVAVVAVLRVARWPFRKSSTDRFSPVRSRECFTDPRFLSPELRGAAAAEEIDH